MRLAWLTRLRALSIIADNYTQKPLINHWVLDWPAVPRYRVTKTTLYRHCEASHKRASIRLGPDSESDRSNATTNSSAVSTA
jgi:hypothetical protein